MTPYDSLLAEARGRPFAAIVGWPVEHSRSPALHGYWLKQHGPVNPSHPAVPAYLFSSVVGFFSASFTGFGGLGRLIVRLAPPQNGSTFRSIS